MRYFEERMGLEKVESQWRGSVTYFGRIRKDTELETNERWKKIRGLNYNKWYRSSVKRYLDI